MGWIIPILLNWYKWIIGIFLIPNTFKAQPNPPKPIHLPLEKIEKNIRERVEEKWKEKKKQNICYKNDENKREIKEYNNKKKKK